MADRPRDRGNWGNALLRSGGVRSRPDDRREDPVRWLPTVAVLLALVLVSPWWPWSRGWGWTPAGMVAVTLATIVVFTLTVSPG